MHTGQAQDLVTLLAQARSGNRLAREIIIERYSPFVMSVVSRSTGKYIRMGEDDESSIGLMALNEAIDGYDMGRGTSFLTFAETVIKRRIIDHLRKQSRNAEVPFSSLLTEQDTSEAELAIDAQNRASIHEYSVRNEEDERREEISSYSAALQQFGMSFAELSRICPKHEDARLSAIRAARAVAEDASLRDFLTQRRELPLRELENRVSVSRKTLERQRKYIIAVALIFIEGYEHLRQFVDK